MSTRMTVGSNALGGPCKGWCEDSSRYLVSSGSNGTGRNWDLSFEHGG